MARSKHILALCVAAGALLWTGCAERVGLNYAFDLQRPQGWLTHSNVGFKSGDQFRLRLIPEQNCFLYVFNYNTDGTYEMLFPRGEESGGANMLLEGAEVQVPAQGTLVFDARPGMEKMYIFASLQPLMWFEAFRGREINIPRDAVEAGIMNVQSACSVHMVHKRIEHPIFVTEVVRTHSEMPVLKCDVDIVHQ